MNHKSFRRDPWALPRDFSPRPFKKKGSNDRPLPLEFWSGKAKALSTKTVSQESEPPALLAP